MLFRSMSHRFKKRRACFVSGGVGGRSDCWGFVRPTTLLGQKIITVWSTLSRWGGRTVGLLGFRPSGHFVGSKNNNSLVISVSLGVVGRSDCWGFVRPSTLSGSKKQRLTLNTANLPCYSLSLEVNGSNCQYLLFDSR